MARWIFLMIKEENLERRIFIAYMKGVKSEKQDNVALFGCAGNILSWQGPTSRVCQTNREWFKEGRAGSDLIPVFSWSRWLRWAGVHERSQEMMADQPPPLEATPLLNEVPLLPHMVNGDSIQQASEPWTGSTGNNWDRGSTKTRQLCRWSAKLGKDVVLSTDVRS